MSEDSAHTLTPANAPYRICEAPKKIYISAFKCVFELLPRDRFYILIMDHGDNGDMETVEEFKSLFLNSPAGCVFELYWRRSTPYRNEVGFLCLLCCKFWSSSPLDIGPDMLWLRMLSHLTLLHYFDKISVSSVVNRLDVKNLLYCDFRLRGVLCEETTILNDILDSEEQMKNSTICCYLCALCGARYAVTPSSELIIAHIKKCDHVKDRVKNNTDGSYLRRLKVPEDL